MIPAILRRCALLFAVSGLCACATAPAPPLASDRLARFFNELVYGNPAEPDGTSPTLVRWAEPRLVYAVSGDRAPADDRRIADAIPTRPVIASLPAP